MATQLAAFSQAQELDRASQENWMRARTPAPIIEEVEEEEQKETMERQDRREKWKQDQILAE